MDRVTEERPETQSLVGAIIAEIITGAAVFIAPALAAAKVVARSMSKGRIETE
jgi:hypothetical protein